MAEIAADLDPISRVAVHQGPLSLSRETGKEPMKKTQLFLLAAVLEKNGFSFSTDNIRIPCQYRNRDTVSVASSSTVSVPLVYA